MVMVCECLQKGQVRMDSGVMDIQCLRCVIRASGWTDILRSLWHE